MFNKNLDFDVVPFNEIITDVEKEYPSIPTDIPFNEYLYQTLMSVEEISTETA